MDPLILLPAQYDPFLAADVRTEDRLEHVIAVQEQRVLAHYKDEPRTVQPGRFRELPATGQVHLIGYREVTQEEVDDGTNPVGTEVGDININTTKDDLLFALRIVIADLVDNFYTRAPEDVIRIDQGDRALVFAASRVETPPSVFRPLRTFDARQNHQWL